MYDERWRGSSIVFFIQERPLAGALGGLLIGCIGVLLPPVMFWGEWEIQTIASGAPAAPHLAEGCARPWHMH